MIYFITGGERSGKSSFAQKLALKFSNSPLYIATSRIWDDDFKNRVEKHKNDRDEKWTTIEEEKNIGDISFNGKVAVIDCVTLWLTNFYIDTNNNVDESLKKAKEQIDKLNSRDEKIIIISNEIGMGIHASTHVARKFTELQGWVNQYIASKSTEAYLMVSGIPVKIK